MSLDFPAFATALWTLYDKTGLRPEYALPVFWLESKFQPGIVNSIGCTGIFQLCPLPGRALPSGFASWSASQQLLGYGVNMYAQTIATYGRINSATRMYQANLLPSTLATAKTLSSVIAQKGSSRLIPRSKLTEAAAYQANAGLDANKDGTITVGDLATKMGQMLAVPTVQQAIAQAYAARPGERPVANPVLGTDFDAGWSAGEIAVATLAGAALLGVGAYLYARA